MEETEVLQMRDWLVAAIAAKGGEIEEVTGPANGRYRIIFAIPGLDNNHVMVTVRGFWPIRFDIPELVIDNKTRPDPP
jgi:hypothetical protein